MIFRPHHRLPILIAVLLVIVGVYVLKARPAGQVTPEPTATITPFADAMMVVNQPLPNASVRSPLKVSGKARGNWYFEASFPVVLTNAQGVEIAHGVARAQSDWMTTDFVPFEVTLTFAKQVAGTKGSLILKKDNPSGLPEHDDSRTIPVVFSQ